ncbi:MAG: SpoIIE family protein phosphatase [Gammaproteobacteria bacterium]|nr:SpoIIE family protein phosphatase [Gammaproteobacteria bacterium]
MAVNYEEMNKTLDARDETRVMIVADEIAQADLLAGILKVQGFITTQVDSGERAIEVYKTFWPDVILMDTVMRGLSGFQVAREIQGINPEIFVPIIFISSHNSSDSVVSCLESGGVDCLIKPYNPAVLNLKIQTFKQIAKLHKTIKDQRDKLAAHTSYLEASYAIAEKVFNKVMQSEVLKSDAIKYYLSPSSIFNGDILFAAYRPTGELHVMLGDFTGHGLSAAIGAIPVSDIFYGMTEKGFSISEIIEEINAKLLLTLPRGLFLAACLVEFSHETRKMTVWNAGLPDIIVFGNDGDIRVRIASKHFPLGIKSNLSLLQSMEVLQLEEGDRLLMFTDGLVEAKNPQQQQYGTDRVLGIIRSNPPGWKSDRIHDDLLRFVGGTNNQDDVTVIEIDLDATSQPIAAKKHKEYPTPTFNAEWKVSYCFGPDMLRQVDPLPILVQSLMEFQKLHKYKQDIFVILKELFINSLDHGLLKLDSSIKTGMNGFSSYMQEREKRLKELSEGIISIELVHSAHPEGGVLDVYVYDTGEGFDTKAILDKTDAQTSGYHGRGLLLIKNICETLVFNDKGNEVHARYQWHY